MPLWKPDFVVLVVAQLCLMKTHLKFNNKISKNTKYLGYLGELLFFSLQFHFDLVFLDRILEDIQLNLMLNEGLKKK